MFGGRGRGGRGGRGICRWHSTHQGCRFGDRCKFAHSDAGAAAPSSSGSGASGSAPSAAAGGRRLDVSALKRELEIRIGKLTANTGLSVPFLVDWLALAADALDRQETAAVLYALAPPPPRAGAAARGGGGLEYLRRLCLATRPVIAHAAAVPTGGSEAPAASAAAATAAAAAAYQCSRLYVEEPITLQALADGRAPLSVFSVARSRGATHLPFLSGCVALLRVLLHPSISLSPCTSVTNPIYHTLFTALGHDAVAGALAHLSSQAPAYNLTATSTRAAGGSALDGGAATAPWVPKDWVELLRPIVSYLSQVLERFQGQEERDRTAAGVRLLWQAVCGVVREHVLGGERGSEARRLLAAMEMVEG